MARSNAVWGIDVGNCSLKAMRCFVEDSDPSMLVVDAVDYIEYPQILTQPGVNADEEIQEAFKLFLSRNKIKGDKIAVAMGGQNGLVRFLKLPPIEQKKIPDIVKYEAKQQIPFLNEVIWKWQRIGQQGASSAFPLEVEIGLFAIKRDQIYKTIGMCDTLNIPVDNIQLTPLALYNYLMHDEMHDLPSLDDYDPENPPPYVVVLSMGTDATDLILTNGFRAWQRNLPIGGNNFTKALMKELKLTFAKADHLKRNLATSQDKVAVLRAMQPVFNSFQNEIQRSLGFFSSLDPNAQYERVVALGNAMKLTGLTKYLSQNLGIDVSLGNSFTSLDTSNLADSSLITENMSTFGTCYGLCLQGLKMGALNINFIPTEVVTTRIINAKKPWMLAATTLLMLGATIQYGAQLSIQDSVSEKNWQVAESSAEGLSKEAKGYVDAIATEEQTFQALDAIGGKFLEGFKNRTSWLELVHGLNACLPVAPKVEGSNLTAEQVMAREEIHITNIEAQPLDDFESMEWMRSAINISEGKVLPVALQKKYKTLNKSGGEEESEGEDGSAMDALIAQALAPEKATQSTGDGEGDDESEEVVATEEDSGEEDSEGGATVKIPKRWVVSVYGYHWHNANDAQVKTSTFVYNNFLDKLSGNVECTFQLPILKSSRLIDPDMIEPEIVTMKDLGVRYPILVNTAIEQMYEGTWKDMRTLVIRDEYQDLDTTKTGMNSNMGMMAESNMVDPTNPQNADVVQLRKGRRYDFVIHFLWEPKSAVDRAEIRAQEKAAKLAQTQADADADALAEDGDDEE